MIKKVIVITGVSSGIGKAFIHKALENTKEGEFVVGLGRTNIPDFTHERYLFIRTDLKYSSSVKQAAQRIKKRLGRVDVLINSAGFGYRSTIEDLSIDEMREQFEVNLFGPLYLTNLVLPLMRKQRHGHIINISSVGSVVSTPTLGYYAATKASLDKLSEVLDQEVEKFNIKVSLLVPGAVKTDFGKNIRIPAGYSKTIYTSLYKEWQYRFAYFFKRQNTAEDVADHLWSLIQKPARVRYISRRDQIMCILKRVLPYLIFQFIFLNYFYRDES